MPHPASRTSQHAGKRAPSLIESRDNRWLKRFRAALSGERGEDGSVGVEGARMVEAALGSGLAVEALLVSESGERHLERLANLVPADATLLRTSDRLFAGIADARTPQGIAALVRPRQTAFAELLRAMPLLMVLAGVQDPGNVGTIVRAAEAFGATGFATCSAGAIGTCDPFAPKALRASAGSALRLPIAHSVAPETIFSELKNHRVSSYAAVAEAAPVKSESRGKNTRSMRDAYAPWAIDWKSPAAILIGNEGAGLPEEIVREADARVYIPLAPSRAAVGIESLNAAMAATALLYEAMRQRNSAREPRS